MTANELKELVKAHFSLVEAEITMENKVVGKTVNETFGELKDENGAFTIKFPGDSLQIGDKVTVVTTEGQEMDAPNGEHRLEDGTRIVTKDSVVEEIVSADDEKEMAEEDVAGVTDGEEIKEDGELEMLEEEPAAEVEVSIEDMTKIISEVVAEEMKKVKDMYEALNAKVETMSAAPASEKTLPKTSESKVEKFSVENAANAERMKLALNLIKNKK